MDLEIKDLPVPIRMDADGVARIGPSRVTLHSVICCYQQGKSAEQILESFDTLKLADVYAVLAFYHRHQDAVDAHLRAYEEEGERIRQQIEAEYPTAHLKAKLLERWAKLQESRQAVE